MVLEFLSLSPWAHVQMHRVKGVVESTSKYYDVGYNCNTGAPHLLKQLDFIKGGPCSGPSDDANSDLNCDPCLSLCPLSRTYKLKKKKKKDYLQRGGLNFSIYVTLFHFKNIILFFNLAIIFILNHIGGCPNIFSLT